MTRPWICRGSGRIAWLAVIVGSLAAGPAEAQTPSNTWTATASGNWSDGTNWNTNPTPPTSGTTTILQFNAGGATSYTATNDITDPFSLKGLLFNSLSSNPITLAGNVGGTGSGALAFSTATPFIVQNNSGAVVINNAITTNNAASASDLNFGGYGSGTVTINGAITGVGGVNFTNLGGATYNLANGANAFTGTGLTVTFGQFAPFGTVATTATSGTPFGSTTLISYVGTIAVTPAATGTDVTVGTATGINFSNFAGGRLLLNKGGNTSLKFTTNSLLYTLTSNSSGSLTLAPASGIANLGLLNGGGTPVGEALTVAVVTAGSGTPINGMLAPTNVGQASAADTTGDFLTYFNGPTAVGGNTYNGLARVQQANVGTGVQGYTNYSTSGGAFSSDTTSTEISNVTANTTASASPTIQALRVTNSTLTIAGGQTVTIGGQTWNASHQQAGIIVNNATIGGAGTLAVGGATAANNELDIYASSTGTSTISAQITSTNPGGTSPALIKFGPGNVVLTNPNNQFTAGAVFTLYGGALVIPGPGGTTQTTVLGTGNRAFIMRGGAFGITGGDYDPAAGSVNFNLVQGGGGFFVDANSTLTLDNSGVLVFLGSGTGTGPLYKTGAGTLALTFPYATGATLTGLQVNQGTLLVNAAITGTVPTGTGGNIPTVVNSSGRLAGTGSVPGNVVINPGGAVAPGASIGTLTVGGAVFQPGGAYQFEHNFATTTPVTGTDNDTINSAGVLDLSALSAANRFIVNLLPVGTGTQAAGPVTYTAGTFASIALPTGVPGPDVTSLFQFTGSFLGTPTAAVNSGVLTFTFTPVPEPTLMLLACAGAAGMATWTRRRWTARI
jgi:fibronectin-binding autotransporter adhesin